MTVRARHIDPRDQKWQFDAPAYRVYFWERGPGAQPGWSSDEYELSGADVDEALAWADANADGRHATVWVVVPGPDGLGLVRLRGTEPVASSDNYPPWAVGPTSDRP